MCLAKRSVGTAQRWCCLARQPSAASHCAALCCAPAPQAYAHFTSVVLVRNSSAAAANLPSSSAGAKFRLLPTNSPLLKDLPPTGETPCQQQLALAASFHAHACVHGCVPGSASTQWLLRRQAQRNGQRACVLRHARLLAAARSVRAAALPWRSACKRCVAPATHTPPAHMRARPSRTLRVPACLRHAQRTATSVSRW